MPIDLEEQILMVLQGVKAGDRPKTFSDLARHFGVSTALISGCAKRMVDKGLAEPSMIDVRGTQVLHGLLPVSAQPKA
ncbi:hypothetical protein BH10ACT8_BH10ACT8_30710 [soil metagenome]|jgi:DNA-binding MarR family transcriptional regulator